MSNSIVMKFGGTSMGSADRIKIAAGITAAEQAGNQINDSRLRFTGSLKDGQIELTRERESVINAGNKGSAQTKAGPSPKQTFRLKKLA